MLAGVAGGVAETLDVDPSLVRIVWALLAIFTGGIAFIVYIVMAIVVPEAPRGFGAPWTAGSPDSGPAAAPQPNVMPGAAGPSDPTPAGQPSSSSWTSEREARRSARRARRRDSGDPGRGGLIAGLILIIIGGVFLVREFVPWFDWHLWWPVGLIALGGLLLVIALLPGRSSE